VFRPGGAIQNSPPFATIDIWGIDLLVRPFRASNVWDLIPEGVALGYYGFSLSGWSFAVVS
jgi:hypothetical protein